MHAVRLICKLTISMIVGVKTQVLHQLFKVCHLYNIVVRQEKDKLLQCQCMFSKGMAPIFYQIHYYQRKPSDFDHHFLLFCSHMQTDLGLY